MKLQFKINLNLNDEFEKKMFTTKSEVFGVEFRKKLLGYLGFLLSLESSDECTVDSFIIAKIPKDSCDDPDIKNDICGVAK